MKNSLARKEFNIRTTLLRGAGIDTLPLAALPEDLRDFTAGLVSTIIDATVHGFPEAIERLRSIAKNHGPKPNAAPHQAERWAAIKVIEQHKADSDEAAETERRAHLLRILAETERRAQALATIGEPTDELATTEQRAKTLCLMLATPPQVEPGGPTPGQRKARMLRNMLTACDEAFHNLDLEVVGGLLVKVRSTHELAARLSLECGAFDDKYTDDTKAGRAADVTRVWRLFERSMNESSRKKPHARKKPAK